MDEEVAIIEERVQSHVLFFLVNSDKVELAIDRLFCRGVRLTSISGKKGGENMAVESALGLMFQFGILIVGIITLAYSFSNKKK